MATHAQAQQRDSSEDFNTLVNASNINPRGIWSDGTTMWVADIIDEKLYAYKMSDRSRDAAKDFNTLSAAGNTYPRGIWSDGTTMWVTNDDDFNNNYKIYAYKMSDRTHDAAKDFNTLSAAGNTGPTDIWTDGTTMWVADADDDKIYAYKMSDRSRDPAKDFNTLVAARNTHPTGIWSDGTTMWVADIFDDKIYAYKMSDRTRDPARDFNTLGAAGNNFPHDLWSDRTTMWVSDGDEEKIYAYKMPRPAPPPLAATVALSLTSNTVPEGAEVGIRVAMSPFVPRNLAIPIVVTAADAGGGGLADVSPDRPRRATIHINGAAYGHNQGVLWLHAIHDGDAHDETYTVAIDTDNLPDGVTVAPPASTTLTIEDSDTAESLALARHIAERDRLIASQENLLNAYRCQFDTDTGLVPGGCDGAEPARTTTPAPPPPNPTQQHLDTRDQLIANQDKLLNAYRCQHNTDTHLVTGGCPT